MPKFHFEIVDGYTLENPTGLHLPSEQNARSFADEIVKQIASDVDDPQLRVVVVKPTAVTSFIRCPSNRRVDFPLFGLSDGNHPIHFGR